MGALYQLLDEPNIYTSSRSCERASSKHPVPDPPQTLKPGGSFSGVLSKILCSSRAQYEQACYDTIIQLQCLPCKRLSQEEASSMSYFLDYFFRSRAPFLGVEESERVLRFQMTFVRSNLFKPTSLGGRQFKQIRTLRPGAFADLIQAQYRGSLLAISLVHRESSLVIHDVCRGLEYLHDNSIIHGDLKPVNILVFEGSRACLTDFGISQIALATTKAITNVDDRESETGSFRWTAPEMFDANGTGPTKESDVWAFACVLYEVCLAQQLVHHVTKGLQMFTGYIPYKEYLDAFHVAAAIRRREQPSHGSPRTPQVPEYLWDLMIMCWDLNPTARPHCKDIRKHMEKCVGKHYDEPLSGNNPMTTLAFYQMLQKETINFKKIYCLLQD
ncbi:hypothetical protein NP233_g2322 [Leucocoprinus birnbaumii]|uniref:Protein kinase domain-containing protein n=1 Tax=Leucocoprinus birnbaumii TaxID=56174 RepID=A0AAD5W2I1_9AGAR|nr:hypothetical protein NP233_g2322 [Leucocoprinus birnbaumii]